MCVDELLTGAGGEFPKPLKGRGGEKEVTLHVYSDASQRDLLFTGAYMIGDSGPFGVRLELCESSVEAELWTAAYALWEARRQHPAAELVLHTDLEQIESILHRNRVSGASELWYALAECEAQVIPDANWHKQHKRCHHHARIMAGIHGTKHPWLKKVKPSLRPTNRERFQAVGWGSYDGLERFVTNYLNACRDNPDAEVRVSR